MTNNPKPAITEVVRTAPEKIWLQVGDLESYNSEPFPPRGEGEVTWERDDVGGCQVMYVESDIAEARLAKYRRALDSKQAKIDALMLEYCPNEMTADQLANYETAQRQSK